MREGNSNYVKRIGNHLPHSAKVRAYSLLLRSRRYLPPPLLRWYHGYSGQAGLVSYPKCGRTWLRVMVGQVLVERYGLDDISPLDWQRLGEATDALPDLFVDHEDNPHQRAPRELERNKAKFKHSRIIFLVRDPRDVVVSLYHHEAYRNATYKDNISSFIRREKGGIDALIAYYNIWAINHQVPEAFLLVHYEDLHADPHAELRRILRFLALDGIDDDLINRAVAYGSFDNMRQMETQNRWQEDTLRILESGRQEAMKTREGRVNNFAQYLNTADIAYLNRKIADHLSPYYRYTQALAHIKGAGQSKATAKPAATVARSTATSIGPGGIKPVG